MATAVESMVDKSKYLQLDECLVTLADIERIVKEKMPGYADHQIVLRRAWTVQDHGKFFLYKEDDQCDATKVLATFRCLIPSSITLHAIKTSAKRIPHCDFKKIYLKFWLDGGVELKMPIFPS